MQFDSLAKIAAGVLELRRRRSEHLPSLLFSEHAWGLLLVLFIADAAGERLNPDEACRRAGEPSSAVQRWLDVLTTMGLVARATLEGQHEVVALTPAGLQAVEACMHDAGEAMRR